MTPRPTELLLRSPHPEADGAFGTLAASLRRVLPVEMRVVPAATDTVEDIRPGAGLVGGGQPAVRRFLEAHPAVGWSWFHLMTSGPDHVVDWAALNHIPLVTYSRGVNARSMAEWVLGAVLHFKRDFDLYTRAQWDPAARGTRWERRWARELTGQHMVILGAGAVAEELGPLARALGLRTTGISRSGQTMAGLDAVLPASDLDEVLPSADILVTLLPLTEATRGTVSAERLARLPEGSLVIVASRGGIMDEGAALRAVRDGHLRGVAFDVFDKEPLPEDAPHWSEPGVLITPHAAGTTDRFMHRLAGIVEAIWRAAFMDGHDPVGQRRDGLAVLERYGLDPNGFGPNR